MRKAFKLLEEIRLRGESESGRVSLYLNKADWRELQRICETAEVSASSVIGRLIRDFITDFQEDRRSHEDAVTHVKAEKAKNR